MRIALPTNDGINISKHVTLSKYFYIYEKDELVDKIENPLIEEVKKNSQMHTHESGGRGLGAGRILPQLIAQKGVNFFLAREIGEGMKNNLQRIGISCFETQEKDISRALNSIK